MPTTTDWYEDLGGILASRVPRFDDLNVDERNSFVSHVLGAVADGATTITIPAHLSVSGQDETVKLPARVLVGR